MLSNINFQTWFSPVPQMGTSCKVKQVANVAGTSQLWQEPSRTMQYKFPKKALWYSFSCYQQGVQIRPVFASERDHLFVNKKAYNVTTLNSKLMCLIKDSVPEYLATVPHAAAKARLAAALCSVWTAGNNTLSRVALWGLISTPTCCASMLMNFATPTLQQCSYIVQVRRLWSIRPE